MFDVKLTAPELASLSTALDHVAGCVLLPLDRDGRAELGELRLKLAGVYLGTHPAAPALAHDEGTSYCTGLPEHSHPDPGAHVLGAGAAALLDRIADGE